MSPRKEPVLTGALLIILGLGIYLLQGTSVGSAVMFLALGGAFLAAYLYRREYGLLIPGCILLGLGLGLALEQRAGGLVGEPVPFGLGIGFLGIYAIDRLYTRSGSWWPLIPGGILVFVGVAEDVHLVRWFFRRGWPLAIALVGAFILLRGLVGRQRSG